MPFRQRFRALAGRPITRLAIAASLYSAMVGVGLAGDRSFGKLHWYVPIVQAEPLRESCQPWYDCWTPFDNSWQACRDVRRARWGGEPRAASDLEPTTAWAPGNWYAAHVPREPVSQRVPPLLSDEESAVAPDVVGPEDRFDAETFAPFARRPFLGFPPNLDDGANYGIERCVARDELHCPARSIFASPCQAIAAPDASAPYERLKLEAIRPRPVVPSGTMFLWSVRPNVPEPVREFMSTTPSAGFVLSRPPGVYSLDWVGVAITAPVR